MAVDVYGLYKCIVVIVELNASGYKAVLMEYNLVCHSVRHLNFI